MEDEAIIQLYFERSEQAIAETAEKYKGYCGSIAHRVLHNPEDEEECLNDTWIKTWQSIPPKRPSCLRVFLGTITRNLSISKLRTVSRRKEREARQICEELQACLCNQHKEEERTESIVIVNALNRFLRDQPPEQQTMFVRRYWYFCSVKELAAMYNVSESKVKMSLLRSRERLKMILEQEGITV